VKVLQWRIRSWISLRSAPAGVAGADALPRSADRAPIAEDLRVLDHRRARGDVREMAHGAAAVERLWMPARFRITQVAPDAHADW